jgi:hypothetical protein
MIVVVFFVVAAALSHDHGSVSDAAKVTFRVPAPRIGEQHERSAAGASLPGPSRFVVWALQRRRRNRRPVLDVMRGIATPLTIAERRLASTRRDTRQAFPVRHVPAAPERLARAANNHGSGSQSGMALRQGQAKLAAPQARPCARVRMPAAAVRDHNRLPAPRLGRWTAQAQRVRQMRISFIRWQA